MKAAPHVALVVAVGLVACAQPARDRGEEHRREPVASLWTCGSYPVDLLFVIDTSASMAQEQEILAEQLRLIAWELIYPSRPDDQLGARDLHIGVVTADMDDPSTRGVLRNASGADGCAPTSSARNCDRDTACPWLTYDIIDPDDGTDPDDPPVWDDLACVVGSLGAGGSSIERPLDAARAALTVQAEPGMPNEGFLRERSVIGIVFITDEDDCSGLDLTDAVEPGVECILHEDELTPVAEFRDALIALRGGDENLFALSVIGGFPLDGSWDIGDPFADLRELRRIEGAEPAPRCETASATAVPPLRLTELVYTFGNNGYLGSICRPEWAPGTTMFHHHIQPLIGPPCVSGPLARDAASICEVTMVLYDRAECPGLADDPGPGRTTGWSVDLGHDADGKRVCRILPADLDDDACPDGAARCPPSWVDMGAPWCGRNWDAGEDGLQGWLIDHSDPACEFGELRFTDNRITSVSGTIRMECIK
jgi:hypothetical protein